MCFVQLSLSSKAIIRPIYKLLINIGNIVLIDLLGSHDWVLHRISCVSPLLPVRVRVPSSPQASEQSDQDTPANGSTAQIHTKSVCDYDWLRSSNQRTLIYFYLFYLFI